MIPSMWNLDKMMQDAEDRSLINDQPLENELTGKSKLEVGTELLKRCEEREARFRENAIAAERDGDDQATWFAMAARAENNRLIEKIRADLAILSEAKPR